MMSVELRFQVSKIVEANGKSMISRERKESSVSSPRVNVDVGYNLSVRFFRSTSLI